MVQGCPHDALMRRIETAVCNNRCRALAARGRPARHARPGPAGREIVAAAATGVCRHRIREVAESRGRTAGAKASTGTAACAPWRRRRRRLAPSRRRTSGPTPSSAADCLPPAQPQLCGTGLRAPARARGHNGRCRQVHAAVGASQEEGGHTHGHTHTCMSLRPHTQEHTHTHTHT